jgi:hypothetical protein
MALCKWLKLNGLSQLIKNVMLWDGSVYKEKDSFKGFIQMSQWDNLLKNLGAWEGSFTRLSPQGKIQKDIPSLVTLNGLNENQTIRQTIQHFSSTGEVIYDRVLEYSSLNKSVLVFDTGAFSQGSIQFASTSEFGAELGLIHGDRRLRLVQLFNQVEQSNQIEQNSQLAKLTLIREHRQHTPIDERPHLSVEMLIGEWQGEAITLYPDWRSPDRYTTQLEIRLEGDRLRQQLSTAQMSFTSTAKVSGSRLLFEDGQYPVQVLLLPDGASSNTPLTIPKGIPFILEAGWLTEPGLRQRLIRRYDAQGGWQSLTLVTERKVA